MNEDPNVLYPKPVEQYITDFKFTVLYFPLRVAIHITEMIPVLGVAFRY